MPDRNLQSYLASWKERNNRLAIGSTTTIEGLTVSVRAGVFSPDPKLTNSTSMLIRSLPDLSGKTVLDIGTGCGIVAAYAARQGATRVTATDIQHEAIENVKDTVASLGLGETIEVLPSDVFDGISDTYDVIAANLPFMVTEYVMNDIATETYKRFLGGVKAHLSPGGAAFLTFASFGDLASLRSMIESGAFAAKTITEVCGDVEWYVFELRGEEI